MFSTALIGLAAGMYVKNRPLQQPIVRNSTLALLMMETEITEVSKQC